jgi:hypothetical protein
VLNPPVKTLSNTLIRHLYQIIIVSALHSLNTCKIRHEIYGRSGYPLIVFRQGRRCIFGCVRLAVACVLNPPVKTLSNTLIRHLYQIIIVSALHSLNTCKIRHEIYGRSDCPLIVFRQGRQCIFSCVRLAAAGVLNPPVKALSNTLIRRRWTLKIRRLTIKTLGHIHFRLAVIKA